MGTLRRDVIRAFVGLKKLLTTPLKFRKTVIPVRGVGQPPVVQGFTPYFFAPSMQDRLEHAQKSLERWFQEFVVDQTLRFKRSRSYVRPAFYRTCRH